MNEDDLRKLAKVNSELGISKDIQDIAHQGTDSSQDLIIYFYMMKRKMSKEDFNDYLSARLLSFIICFTENVDEGMAILNHMKQNLCIVDKALNDDKFVEKMKNKKV